MDVPVALGIGATFVVSSGAMFEPDGSFGHEVYFDSMTTFVSFLMVGRYLELKARHRVAAALGGAVSRLPESARRIDAHGAVVVIALAGLRNGDATRCACCAAKLSPPTAASSSATPRPTKPC